MDIELLTVKLDGCIINRRGLMRVYTASGGHQFKYELLPPPLSSEEGPGDAVLGLGW